MRNVDYPHHVYPLTKAIYVLKQAPRPWYQELHKQKYVTDLLSKHNMLDCNPISTSLVVGTSLTAHDGTMPIDTTMYRQVVGGLQHLWMTRLDISFAVNKLSQFMHAPSEQHLGAVKVLLRYLNGMKSFGIRLLVDTPLVLHGFFDVN